MALAWGQFVDPWALDQMGWKYASLYIFFPVSVRICLPDCSTSCTVDGLVLS